MIFHDPERTGSLIQDVRIPGIVLKFFQKNLEIALSFSFQHITVMFEDQRKQCDREAADHLFVHPAFEAGPFWDDPGDAQAALADLAVCFLVAVVQLDGADAASFFDEC